MFGSGIKFVLGFAPKGSQKRAIKQTKAEIRDRLAGRGLRRLKIVLKQASSANRIRLQILGKPETVDMAKSILGIR